MYQYIPEIREKMQIQGNNMAQIRYLQTQLDEKLETHLKEHETYKKENITKKYRKLK